jgi:diguanylate cyclase (GGDEF)-like protein
LLHQAEREIARALRYKIPLALVIFDIDNFKNVNDTFGHAAGDKVLAELAGHVRTSLRPSDIVGRYGGEEFVILLPHTSSESALRLVERIRESVASLTVRAGDDQVSVSISSGIAGLLGAEENDGLDRLLDRADRALYAAKEGGRNRTNIYQAPDSRAGLPDSVQP